MARYLISTALKKNGAFLKNQPADRFRKMLIRQKIAFTERELCPLRDRIDLELQSGDWDRPRRSFRNVPQATYRERSQIQFLPTTEFIFDNEGAL